MRRNPVKAHPLGTVGAGGLMFALSLLVPVSGKWHLALIAFAVLCVLMIVIGFFLPTPRDRIAFEFGTPYFKRRGWTVRRFRIGGAHAASASYAGTIPVSAGGYEDETEYGTFAYLPVKNTHPSLSADDVQAAFTFEAVTGAVIHGPWDARWMNAKNPGLQNPLTNPESYRRMRIPAGSDEPLDLFYYGQAGTCYVYTDESARSGRKFDPATQINDAAFRIKMEVRAPNAAPLSGTFLVEWKGDDLEIRREA